VEYGKGFYGEERHERGTWRWMGSDGVIRLQSRGRAMTLTIVGHVSGPFPKRPTMTLEFNGAVLDEFSAPQGTFRKEYLLTPAQQAADGWSELHIHTDMTAVPKEVSKGSNDARVLGFRLLELRWEADEQAAPPPGQEAQIGHGARRVQRAVQEQAAPPPDPLPDPAPEPVRTPLLRVMAVLGFLLVVSAALGAWLFRRLRAPHTEAPAPPLRARCAGCGQRVVARAALAGKKVKCPRCGQPVCLPGSGPGTPAPAPGNEPARAATAMRAGGLAVLALLVGLGGLIFALSPAQRPAVLNTLLGCEPVPGVEESGFYDPEVDPQGQPFRWTDGSARLVIPLDPARPPRALWVQFHTRRSPKVPAATVRMVVNGRELFSGEPADDLWEETVDLSQGGLGDQLTLEILTNTFAPQDVPGSTSSDARPLGVRVTGVRLLGPAE
jgi:hypothetical protein